jgi:uncharacterized membrane protein
MLASAENLDVSISNQSAIIWEIFEINIELSDVQIGAGNINFNIPGIENFDIFSQSQWSVNQIINGEVNSASTFTLSLMPKIPGEYNIWPISYKINGEEFTDEKIFSIEILSLIPKTSVPLDEPWVIHKNTQDIHPLRATTFPIIPLILVIVWFLGIFYILLMYVRKQNNPSQVPQHILVEVWEVKKDYKISLEEYFTKLFHRQETIHTQEFYRYYNAGLREILMHEWFPHAQKSTLKELDKNKKLHTCFAYKIMQETYFKEFKDSEKNLWEQEWYIKNILSYLKK